MLDNAHFDNERKVEFYRLMDRVNETRPIAAIPLGFDKGGPVTKKILGDHKKALDDLNEGQKSNIPISKKDELVAMFEDKGGPEMFFKDFDDGKITGKPGNPGRIRQ